MTIYVCQEMEQNRLPLPQEQDGSGDNSLFGERGGACSCLLSLFSFCFQCFSYFSPSNSNFRKEVCYDSQSGGTVHVADAPGHVASTARKRSNEFWCSVGWLPSMH